MWEFAVISIDWRGQAFTDEQMLVLRNVAARYLRTGKKHVELNFKHPLCEGTIKREREGTYGMFAGTFFRADLGTVRGERWTCDFLLLRGTEHIILDDDAVVISARSFGTNGVKFSRVDASKASIGDQEHPNRSQAVH